MAASACKNTPNWPCLTNMAALKLLFLFALSLHLYQGAIADEASNVTIRPILPVKQTIKTAATAVTPHSTAQHTAKPLPPVDCKKYAKTNVDLKQLSSAVFWYFDETGDCHDTSKTDACEFNFAFCRPLPADATPGVAPGQYGASQTTSAEAGSKAIILGKIGTIKENNHVDIGLELTVQYRNGDDASDVCTGKEKKLGVDLHLHCDKKAKWHSPLIGEAGKMPTETVAVFRKEECKYIVTTVYDGVCNITAPTVAPISTGLSAGTIIIIIFFSLAIVYIVVGLIYNVTKGAHGLELIPNYDMWRMFPADVVGGLGFVWSIITCQGGHKTKVYDDL